MKDVKDVTVETAEEIKDKAEEGAKVAAHKLQETASYSAEKVKNAADRVVVPIASKYESMKDTLYERAKEARDYAAEQKRQADLDNKKGKPTGGDGSNPSLDNVVEELFGALKGGDIFKNRRTQQQQQKMAPITSPNQFPVKLRLRQGRDGPVRAVVWGVVNGLPEAGMLAHVCGAGPFPVAHLGRRCMLHHLPLLPR